MSFNARSECRFWVATFNNYTNFVYEQLIEWSKTNTTYACIGKEVSSTFTPHLQCFFGLKKKYRMSALKKAFAPLGNPHLQPAKAEGKVASDYCKKGAQSHEEWDESGTEGPNFGKDADFWEFGTIPTTSGGSRGAANATAARTAVYAEAIELAKKRKFDEIDPGMLVRHYGNFQRIAADNPLPICNLNKPCAEWIYGPPGTGKSFTARKENSVFYWKACNKWWDGYKGQPVVLIDDFDCNHKVLGHHMKIWLDEYAFGAEIKGSTLGEIRPPKFVITSNYHPDQIWHDDLVLAAAIVRRCTMRYMNTPYVHSDASPYPATAENFWRPKLTISTPDMVSDSPPVVTPPAREFDAFEYSASQDEFLNLENF